MEVNPAAQGGWGTAGRAAAWVNLVLQVALLLALLVVVNLLARKAGTRIDLTTRRAFSLSDPMADALRNLPYTLEVWFTSEQYSLVDDKSVPVARQRTVELLGELSNRSDKVFVYPVSGLGAEQWEVLAKNFPPPLAPNVLYLVATHPDQRTSRKSLPLSSLYQGNPYTGVIESYQGEAVLLQAIRGLSFSTKRIVYETQGHQELLMGDARTMGMVAHFLSTNEGVEFRPFSSQSRQGVPEDCDALAILGPAHPFLPGEIERIRDYLESGGSLFVALRPLTQSGLEPLLEEYGVKVGRNIVLDPRESVHGRGLSALQPRRFVAHEINQGMGNAFLYFPDACALEYVQRDWAVVGLASSSPESWAERGPLGPNVRPRPDGEEKVGEQTLIAAIEKSAPRPRDERRSKIRIVVWGSALALTNSAIQPMDFPHTLQLQYAANSLRWLMERPVMEIPPKVVHEGPFAISSEAFGRIKAFTMLGFPLLGVLLGGVAWFVRRK